MKALNKIENTIKGKINFWLGKPHFATHNLQLGQNVSFGRNVRFNCKKIRIGDGCIIKDNVVVDAEEFEMGDYGTIYQDCFFPGPGKIKIGHNFWLGNNSIIDSKGGTVIGNNVGIGAHSQLWTHIAYGDMLIGCRYNNDKSLNIGNDVWLVGHCLVSPVNIGERSMAMLGSLIVKDMEADKTYGGVPAKEITDKVGAQFAFTTIEQRKILLWAKIEEFALHRQIKNIREIVDVVDNNSIYKDSSKIIFNVEKRTYTKINTNIEFNMIRFLLPDIKFLPA